MFIKSLRESSSSSSLSVEKSTAQDPIAKTRAPFDRDNARWTPITITVGTETCEIEALFDVKNPSNQLPDEIMACPVKELKAMTAITRPGSYHVILCAPFEKLQKQPPGSFADFQTVVKTGMLALLPRDAKELESAIAEEMQAPNGALFSLQMHIAPKGETTSKAASLIRAYATKNAIYILSDRSVDAATNPHTLSFFSSFKIERA